MISPGSIYGAFYFYLNRNRIIQSRKKFKFCFFENSLFNGRVFYKTLILRLSQIISF